MLACLFGTPSPLTYWTLHAVRIILNHTSPGYSFIHITRIGQLQDEWQKIKQDSNGDILFFSDCPDAGVSDLICNVRIPKIVVQEELKDIILYNMLSRDMKIEPAIRFITQSVSCLGEIIKSDDKLAILSDIYYKKVSEIIFDICRYLGIAGTDDLVAAITRDLIGGQALTPDSLAGEFILGGNPTARWPGEFEFEHSRDRDLFEKVLVSYADIKPGSQIRAVVWPPELFSDWDRPGHFVEGPIRLVGGLRFIVCGPYLHLPKGRWRSQISFEVENNKSGNTLYSDILAGGKVVTGIITTLPKRGAFEYEMEFLVQDPFLPLEVRFEIREGAIEGLFKLGFVRMVRQD